MLFQCLDTVKIKVSYPFLFTLNVITFSIGGLDGHSVVILLLSVSERNSAKLPLYFYLLRCCIGVTSGMQRKEPGAGATWDACKRSLLT